jgi:Domain of unknown function (DUF5666)
MRTRTVITIIGATAALGAGGAVAGASAAGTAALGSSAGQASQTQSAGLAARHFEGRVVAINRRARAFTVRDVERGTVRIRVGPSTRFDRIAGFSALRIGQRVEVRAIRAGGGLIATRVQLSGRNATRVSSSDRTGANSGARHNDRRDNDLGDDRGHDRADNDLADDRGHDRADRDLGDDRGQGGAGHDAGDDRGGRGHG